MIWARDKGYSCMFLHRSLSRPNHSFGITLLTSPCLYAHLQRKSFCRDHVGGWQGLHACSSVAIPTSCDDDNQIGHRGNDVLESQNTKLPQGIRLARSNRESQPCMSGMASDATGILSRDQGSLLITGCKARQIQYLKETPC